MRLCVKFNNISVKNLFTSNAIHSYQRRSSSSLPQKFWKWTSQTRPSWRESPTEAVVIFTVFGLSGSASLLFVRPVLKNVLGLEGSFMDSPVSYTLATILITSPMYSVVVFSIGTLAGRHIFFANMAKKVIGRFLPRSTREKIVCTVATKKSP